MVYQQVTCASEPCKECGDRAHVDRGNAHPAHMIRWAGIVTPGIVDCSSMREIAVIHPSTVMKKSMTSIAVVKRQINI
jgi:hypothetical protein